MDVDVEGPHGPGDAYIPTLADEPMHIVHAEIGVGLAHDPQVVEEKGVARSIE